mmetsp:Transcript_8041/g.29713  ORF Transcript_8041/g.29713 Transcript_8041/m.29713 type:complete len:640 (+) Transcript_8041:136-2055(+)
MACAAQHVVQSLAKVAGALRPGAAESGEVSTRYAEEALQHSLRSLELRTGSLSSGVPRTTVSLRDLKAAVAELRSAQRATAASLETRSELGNAPGFNSLCLQLLRNVWLLLGEYEREVPTGVGVEKAPNRPLTVSSMKQSMLVVQAAADGHDIDSISIGQEDVSSSLEEYERHEQMGEVLVNILRFIRNLVAGCEHNTTFFGSSEALALQFGIVRKLCTEDGVRLFVDRASAQAGLRASIQLLANLTAGVCTETVNAVWRLGFPDVWILLSAVPGGQVQEPACMVLRNCVRSLPVASDQLLSDVQVLRNLLELAAADIVEENSSRDAGHRERPANMQVGGGDTLRTVICHICFTRKCLAGLLQRLHGSESTGDQDNVEKKEGELSVALASLCCIIGEELQLSAQSKREHRIVSLPAEDARVLLHLIGVASASLRNMIANLSANDPQASFGNVAPTRIGVLSGCMLAVRSAVASHVDDSSLGAFHRELLDQGMVQIMLELLSAMPAPDPRHNVDSNDPDVMYEVQCLYSEHRADILAVLANACYRDQQAQDEILERGGVELILAQCVADVKSPIAREWALLCVRNLCAGNIAVQDHIAALQVCDTVQHPALTNMGLRLDIDEATGAPRLVPVPPMSDGPV